ncbi:MAG: bifunctional DNA-formamidopyrimidine glycosylase/DNA-(apurinic or apyrimidinic site) lyase [Chloroflexi bacterium]|nr:bifunctional DNA-formamidopyrimidine glycosylase/DNA-(apurinic or apyrimidinic site) lyase [Chloroflexota bacterium]
MPELPEVETIARQLRGLVTGRVIGAFRSHWGRLTEPVPPRHFARRLVDRRIEGVRRRGKLVLFDLDGGDVLVVSLRMTGQLLFREAEAPPDLRVRGVIAFTDRSEVRFVDTRKFGRMAIVDGREIGADGTARSAAGARAHGPLHATSGIEPLSRAFTTRWLGDFLHRRGRSAIKVLLLDPRGIAGIGNIYDCEALWRARIHPTRLAGSLTTAEAARLHEAIGWVLRKGIRLGGASRRDYLDARGRAGRMQREFQVYAQADRPCPRCGRAIVRSVQGGRATFHCPRCQTVRVP